MSRIVVKIVNRTIEFVDSPPVYSGGKNVDDIQFQFDSEWSTFKKTAVFYRSEDNQFMKELIEDVCTIPHEVLTHDGKLYFGVFGESGDKVITSKLVVYTIDQGVLTDPVSTDDPTFWDKLLEIKNEILQAKEEAHGYADEAKGWANQAQQNAEQLAGQYYNGIIAKGETYSGIASNKGIKLHKVVGKTEQETTNGYQLFDPSYFPTKTQGGATVTNNNDGSFAVSGSGNLTEDFKVVYTIQHDLTIKLLKVGTIKLNNGVKTYPTVIINFISNGKEISGLTEDKSFEVTQDMLNDSTFAMRMYIYGINTYPIKPGTIKPMLYQDGDGTWEQYTGGKPGPNPDGAIEIKNVEIKKIISSNKNIIANVPDNLGHSKCTYVYNNETKILTIQATENDARVGEVSQPGGSYKATNGVLYLIPKNAIKVYFKSETGAFNAVYATFYNKDKVSLGFAMVGSYTIPEGAKYVSFRIGVNPSTSGKSYSDRVYASFEEIREYVEGKYNEVETSLTLAEGDVYEDGVATRKKRIVELTSSMDWKINVSGTRIYTLIDGLVIKTNSDIKSNYFTKGSWENDEENTICLGNEMGAVVGVSKTQFGTAEAFKAWLDEKKSQGKPCIMVADLKIQTKEKLKVTTIPSYNPDTNIWTDNTLPTDIEWELLANSDNSLMNEEILKRIEALEAKALER